MDSQYALATMYRDGNGCEQDIYKAISWFEKAAEEGHVEAQYCLGAIYRDGWEDDDSIQDDDKAWYWLEQAAHQGDADAQYVVALMCRDGEGFDPDETAAQEWFELAAEQGYKEAIKALKELNLKQNKSSKRISVSNNNNNISNQSERTFTVPISKATSAEPTFKVPVSKATPPTLQSSKLGIFERKVVVSHKEVIKLSAGIENTSLAVQIAGIRAEAANLPPVYDMLTRDWGHSPYRQSPHTKVTLKKERIYTVAEVDRVTHEITFKLSNDRPDTKYVNSQGDHITSYITILLAIISATDKNTILDAISRVNDLLDVIVKNKELSIVGDEGLATLRSILHSLIPLYKDGFRQELKEKLNDTNLPTSLKAFINTSVKFNKVHGLATGLAQLVNYILVYIQQKDDISSDFSKGRINKKENEGSTTKDAVRFLEMLNRFCQLSKMDDEELASHIDSLILGLSKNSQRSRQEEHRIRYGLKIAFGGNEAEVDKLLSNLKQQARYLNDPLSKNQSKTALQNIRNELQTITNSILNKADDVAERIGHLYDYQYELIFNESSLLNKVKPHQRKNTALIHDYFIARLSQVIEVADIVTKIERGKQEHHYHINRKDKERLFDTIDRHFSLVGAAFPHLIELEQYHLIKEAFLKYEVLAKAGWENFPLQMGELKHLLEDDIAESHAKSSGPK